MATPAPHVSFGISAFPGACQYPVSSSDLPDLVVCVSYWMMTTVVVLSLWCLLSFLLVIALYLTREWREAYLKRKRRDIFNEVYNMEYAAGSKEDASSLLEKSASMSE
jgi:hypothetical protein